MGRKSAKTRVLMLRYILFFTFLTPLYAESLYDRLEFSTNERAKVIVLDKEMRIMQVLNVQKGQKELKLNLQNSENLFITFIENQNLAKDSKDAPLAKDSKYLAQFVESQKASTIHFKRENAQNLEAGIEGAEFAGAITPYEARFERNRFLGGFLGFEPYKFNYLLPANVSLKSEDGHTKRTEAKFQISFKKLIFDDLYFKDLDLYFSYTQQSFWQVYDSDNSRPFRESNYEPALFFSYPIDTYNLFFDRVNFGYVHQSNGGDLSKSRSWDRLFIEGVYAYDNFVFGLKAWYRIKEDASKDDNPDILNYMGYGELSMGYLFNQHLLTLTLRNNLKSDNKGAIILDYSYPIYKNLYLYVQYFSGYGESLIDYNRSIDRIGVGLLFTR